MRDRLILQARLEALRVGVSVYFQPPPQVKLKYPCIVYQRDDTYKAAADNVGYLFLRMYTVTAIYKDPDDDLPDRIVKLPYTTHSTSFIADNLYHQVFTLYF